MFKEYKEILSGHLMKVFTRNWLLPSGSKPGILISLPKVHKLNCPLGPILNDIGTSNGNLVKFFLPLLSEFCSNQFTKKNPYSFKQEIPSLKRNNMASFDIKSVFMNIPLDESIIIQICTRQVCADQTSEFKEK